MKNYHGSFFASDLGLSIAFGFRGFKASMVSGFGDSWALGLLADSGIPSFKAGLISAGLHPAVREDALTGLACSILFVDEKL